MLQNITAANLTVYRTDIIFQRTG